MLAPHDEGPTQRQLNLLAFMLRQLRWNTSQALIEKERYFLFGFVLALELHPDTGLKLRALVNNAAQHAQDAARPPLATGG